ncbi:MAG TPA: response regulator [Terracidiphilus sp.]|jgi:FixJ family two-component response regulator
MTIDQIIFVVDDDPRMRSSLKDLFDSMGIANMVFGSAGEYVAAEKPDTICCLLLDVNLPDLNGLDLQEKLAQADHPPIIFITGYGDIPSSVKAMKAGAVDFLPKPFKQQDLIRAVREAFDRDEKLRKLRADSAELRGRYARLTPREREVLPLIIGGMLNKQAAAELGIAEITCQVHRGQIMRKLAAGSLADLVRMAGRLGILPPGQDKR